MRSIALVLTLLLPSCGLVSLPFRVAGGAVKVTEKAITAPVEAARKRKQKKARERRAEERTERREPEARARPEMPDTDESLPDFSSDLPDFPDDPLPPMAPGP